MTTPSTDGSTDPGTPVSTRASGAARRREAGGGTARSARGRGVARGRAAPQREPPPPPAATAKRRARASSRRAPARAGRCALSRGRSGRHRRCRRSHRVVAAASGAALGRTGCRETRGGGQRAGRRLPVDGHALFPPLTVAGEGMNDRVGLPAHGRTGTAGDLERDGAHCGGGGAPSRRQTGTFSPRTLLENLRLAQQVVGTSVYKISSQRARGTCWSAQRSVTATHRSITRCTGPAAPGRASVDELSTASQSTLISEEHPEMRDMPESCHPLAVALAPLQVALRPV